MTASLAMMAALLASTNLLPDGGFEKGQWELTRWDHGTSKHEYAAPGRTGSRCVHLVGISEDTGRINELAISPVLPAEPGATYVFSVWYKSSGEARPYLSMVSFAQPFSAAQWKTPREQYIHKYLPAAADWRLALWRFRVSPKAVEMRVMARLAGVGEAWFDDASLVKVGQAKLATTCPGDFASLPDGRLYEARVDVPQDAAWRLILTDPDGQEISSAEGVGPTQAARIRFSCAPGKKLRAILYLDDAVADYADFTAPPLLELALLTPRYRRTVFTSHKPEDIRAQLTAHALPQVYRKISYNAALVRPGTCPANQTYQVMSQPIVEIRLAAGKLEPGAWRLQVQTTGAPGYEELTVPIKVLPPGKPHEVIIDEHNRLLVDGKPLFPCGFYGAPDNDNLTRPIAEAGYNTILTYGSSPDFCKRWLDVCQRLGLWGMIHLPRPFVGKGFDEEKLREAIRVVKNHPALLAYYLFDEPSPSRPGQTPEDLKRVYDVLADEDPYHPVAVCINVPANERLYIDAYDIVMIDVYPVRHQRRPLTNIAARMDHAWEATQRRKPVWFIPQTFGYDVVTGLPGPPTWLTPTPQEEMAMQYLALTHGARGAIAYCYHVYTRYDAEAKKQGKWPWKLGGYLPTKQKKLWTALVQLGKQYKSLQRALTQPRISWKQFGKIHVAWFSDGGKDIWLLAVNGERDQADEQAVPAVPDQLNRRPLRAENAFTGDDVPLRDGTVLLRLGPMQTTALRIRVRPTGAAR